MSLIDENFWIFGGRQNLFRFSDKLVKFNTVSETFQEVQGTGQSPTARIHHCSFVHNKILFVFGGTVKNEKNEFQETNDLFSFNPLTNSWKNETSKGTHPEPLTGHTCIAFHDRVYVFGGISDKKSNGKRELIEKISVLNMKDMSWSQLPVSMKSRIYHSSSLSDNKVFIYGGRNLHDTLNDLVVFDLIKEDWLIHKVQGFGPRQKLCSGVYNTDILFFGGKTGINWLHLYNDLHSLNVKPQEISDNEKDLLELLTQESYSVSLLIQHEITSSDSKEKIKGFLTKEQQEDKDLEELLEKLHSLREIIPIINNIQGIRQTLSREAHGSKGKIDRFDKFYNQTIEQKSKLSQVRETLKKRKEELQNLVTELDNAVQTKNVNEKRYLEDQKKIETLKTTIKEKDEKINDKKDQKQKKEKEITELEEEINKSTLEYTNQADTINSSKKRLAEAESNLAQLTIDLKNIEEKKLEKEAMANEMNKKKSEIEKKYQEVEGLKSMEGLIQSQLEIIEKGFVTLSSAMEKVVHVIGEREKVEYKKPDFAEKLIRAINERKQLHKKEMEDIENSLNKIAQEIIDISKSIEKLKEQKAKLEKEISGLKEKIESTENKFQNGTNKLRLEKLNQEVKTLKDEISDLISSIDDNKRDLQRLSESTQSKKKEYDESLEKLVQLQNNQKTIETQARNEAIESREARKLFKTLNEELSDVKHQIEASKNVFETQEIEFKRLYNILNEKFDAINKENLLLKERIAFLENELKEFEKLKKECQKKEETTEKKEETTEKKEETTEKKEEKVESQEETK